MIYPASIALTLTNASHPMDMAKFSKLGTCPSTKKGRATCKSLYDLKPKMKEKRYGQAEYGSSKRIGIFINEEEVKTGIKYHRRHKSYTRRKEKALLK